MVNARIKPVIVRKNICRSPSARTQGRKSLPYAQERRHPGLTCTVRRLRSACTLCPRSNSQDGCLPHRKTTRRRLAGDRWHHRNVSPDRKNEQSGQLLPACSSNLPSVSLDYFALASPLKFDLAAPDVTAVDFASAATLFDLTAEAAATAGLTGAALAIAATLFDFTAEAAAAAGLTGAALASAATPFDFTAEEAAVAGLTGAAFAIAATPFDFTAEEAAVAGLARDDVAIAPMFDLTALAAAAAALAGATLAIEPTLDFTA